MMLPFTITHSPTGDEAEALDAEAALRAARELIADNGHNGHCMIFHGAGWVDMVWADDPTSYTHVGARA
jgi:hypothetical protein